MADRISGLIALAIVLAYGFIAFTIIEAPFQYDPLGPETWPQILAVVAALCCMYILFVPDNVNFILVQSTLLRLIIVLIMLAAYAWLFEPAGFIIATAIFCTALSLLLGAGYRQALLFGAATGVLGQIICVNLLDLNLPEGLLSSIL